MMLPHPWHGGASAWVWKITFSFDSIEEARLAFAASDVRSSGVVSATTTDIG